MAIYNASLLISASNATYFTNVTGGIAAVDVRNFNDTWISSSALLTGSNTFVGNQIISGNVDINGTITASLQTGYLYVGNGSGKTQAVATSSIIANTDTGSLLVTGSVSGNTLTFTKGDASTFNLSVATGSTANIDTGSFATTGSNTFNGNQIINGVGYNEALTIVSENSDQSFLIYRSGSVTQNWEFGITGPGNSFLKTRNRTWVQNDGYDGELMIHYLPTKFEAGIYTSGPANTLDITGSLRVTNNLSSNDIFVTGSAIITQNLTASLQQGYAWVGGVGNVSTAVATSSFGTPINTGSFATTGSNTFNGNQNIVGDITLLSGSNLGKITFPNNSQLSGVYGDQFKFAASETSAQFLINSSSSPLNMIFENRGNGGQTQFLTTYGSEYHSASSYQFNGGNVTINGNIYANNLTGSSGVSGSYATLGANTFTGSQTIQSGSQIIFNGLNGSSNDNGLVWGASTSYPAKLFYQSGSSGNFLQFAGDVGIDFSVGQPATANSNINFRTQNTSGQIQFTSDSSSISLKSGTTTTISGSSIALNVNTGGTITNRGVVSIGQNVGSGIGESYLLGYSGSLVLGNSTATPTYAALSHISSSQINSNSNLILKPNTNTVSTIVSGSGNIFVNASAATAGFARYVGGSGNIYNGGTWTQISSSMQFSPVMNRNIGNSVITMRGPVSSSQWTLNDNVIPGTVNIGGSAANHAERITGGLTLSTNYIAGGVTIIANGPANLAQLNNFTGNIINGNPLFTPNSSSVVCNFNNINDNAFSLTNNFFSGSAGQGQLSFSRNNIGGQAHVVLAQGGTPAGGAGSPSLSDNTILGGSNTLFVDVANAPLTGSAPYFSAVRNIIGGHNLVVSGSSSLTHGQTFGSAFFGRWNANDGIRNKTAQNVFVVGTGTSSTNTKTGFLIDSGSNTFVEGTFNVSGSSSMTGSVAVTGNQTLQSYTILSNVSASLNFADDTAAAAGGVPLGGLYRNGNFVMIRLT